MSKSERVKIHIYSTNQDTTAIWKLEGCVNADIWVCSLSDISDFEKFSIWNFSKVRIEFSDGRIRERMFYYDCIRNRLTQVDTDNLDFWIKESEDKTMTHEVEITTTENKVIEEYWVIRGMRSADIAEYNINTHVSKSFKNKDLINEEKELNHKPTLQEIAQFLSESKADFVSVEHNYRFADLPFC